MISIDSMATEITKAFKDYTQDVTESIESEVETRSNVLTKEIKAKSPRKTGEYAKGWRRKKVGSGGNLSYVTYNKTRGSLVHLLEKGHAKRGGGRVAGKPHVGPAADRETSLLEQNIKSIIRNGG